MQMERIVHERTCLAMLYATIFAKHVIYYMYIQLVYNNIQLIFCVGNFLYYVKSCHCNLLENGSSVNSGAFYQKRISFYM